MVAMLLIRHAWPTPATGVSKGVTFIIRHCLWKIVLQRNNVGIYLLLNLPVMCLIVIVLLHPFCCFSGGREFCTFCLSTLSAVVISCFEVRCAHFRELLLRLAKFCSCCCLLYNNKYASMLAFAVRNFFPPFVFGVR